LSETLKSSATSSETVPFGSIWFHRPVRLLGRTDGALGDAFGVGVLR
jgi:hypothetical protein